MILVIGIRYSQSTHRYDASDYETVDPYAGTNDDLKLLCDEAHKRGMKIVLDAVFNHTGSDSKYFNKYNEYIGVNSVKRMYEISEQQAFDSEISLREFCVFADSDDNKVKYSDNILAYDGYKYDLLKAIFNSSYVYTLLKSSIPP